MRRALAARRGLAPLREGLAETRPEPLAGRERADRRRPGTADHVPPRAAGHRRRRVAVSALQGAGQSVGGPLRGLAFLAPAQPARDGPNGFPINRTAAAAAIKPAQVGPNWRLRLVAGPRTVVALARRAAAMPQQVHDLPIACVEGLVDDPALERGADQGPRRAGRRGRHVHRCNRSMAQNGVFDSATLASEQTSDERTLLALEGQRRRPVARPRLSGSRDRARHPRRPLHEMGRHDDVQAGVMVRAHFRRLYGRARCTAGAAASLLVAGAAVAGMFDNFRLDHGAGSSCGSRGDRSPTT